MRWPWLRSGRWTARRPGERDRSLGHLHLSGYHPQVRVSDQRDCSAIEVCIDLVRLERARGQCAGHAAAVAPDRVVGIEVDRDVAHDHPIASGGGEGHGFAGGDLVLLGVVVAMRRRDLRWPVAELKLR